MRRVKALLSILPCLLAVPGAALAAGLGPVQEIQASAGSFNVLNHDRTPEVGWEVSFAPRRFHWLPRWVPALSPAAGGMASSGGELYVFAGFRAGLPLGERWLLTPQWGTGLYYDNGRRGLGGPLNFRTGIELSRRLGGRRGRVGLLLYHISNGGLYDRNPGSESLMLTYTASP